MAVRAVKEGATDFVLKPWQNEKFLATLQSALRLRESRIELERIRSREKVMREDIDNKTSSLSSIIKTFTCIVFIIQSSYKKM